MVSSPDIIKKHVSAYCGQCGNELSRSEPVLKVKRQIHDIPPIKMRVTEHQTYACTCSCGHTTEGTYPDGVQHPVSYGSNLEALVGYLHARHYLPFARLKEMLNASDWF